MLFQGEADFQLPCCFLWGGLARLPLMFPYGSRTTWDLPTVFAWSHLPSLARAVKHSQYLLAGRYAFLGGCCFFEKPDQEFSICSQATPHTVSHACPRSSPFARALFALPSCWTTPLHTPFALCCLCMPNKPTHVISFWDPA